MTDNDVSFHSTTDDSNDDAEPHGTALPPDPFEPSLALAREFAIEARQRISLEAAAQRMRVRNHHALGPRRARHGMTSPLTFEIAMKPWDGYVSVHRVMVVLGRVGDCLDEVAAAHAKRCYLAILHYAIAEPVERRAMYARALEQLRLAAAGNDGDEGIVLQHAYKLLIRHGEQEKLIGSEGLPTRDDGRGESAAVE
jgi:hypothetical protein